MRQRWISELSGGGRAQDRPCQRKTAFGLCQPRCREASISVMREQRWKKARAEAGRGTAQQVTGRVCAHPGRFKKARAAVGAASGQHRAGTRREAAACPLCRAKPGPRARRTGAKVSEAAGGAGPPLATGLPRASPRWRGTGREAGPGAGRTAGERGLSRSPRPAVRGTVRVHSADLQRAPTDIRTGPIRPAALPPPPAGTAAPRRAPRHPVPPGRPALRPRAAAAAVRAPRGPEAESGVCLRAAKVAGAAEAARSGGQLARSPRWARWDRAEAQRRAAPPSPARRRGPAASRTRRTAFRNPAPGSSEPAVPLARPQPEPRARTEPGKGARGRRCPPRGSSGLPDRRHVSYLPGLGRGPGSAAAARAALCRAPGAAPPAPGPRRPVGSRRRGWRAAGAAPAVGRSRRGARRSWAAPW